MPVYEPSKLREMYNVTLNNFSTITPLTIPTAGYVGASDGVGGIRFVTQSGGGSVGSNLSLSNLGVINNISSSSTFTNYLSVGQIYASSLIVQSAVIVGSNTLTVYGQTFLSSVTMTGQFLISTIPGQPAQPLSAELISSLNVQTSTVNFVDTTNAGIIKSLYVEAGSLKYDGATLGTTSIGSNFGFINLNVIDTLSTSSAFTNYISAGSGYISSLLMNSVKINATDNMIAIGQDAGESQDQNTIALGFRAGQLQQSTASIAIGYNAGRLYQREYAIAIGQSAGSGNQCAESIAIGNEAGNIDQSTFAIAIGKAAGTNTQRDYAISIGYAAGSSQQQPSAIAIGRSAGETTQSTNAIAIGQNAGKIAQGENAIAIGFFAGFDNQSTNTIILNATGNQLDTKYDNSIYIAPVRPDNSPANVLFYNTTTKEVSYGAGGGGSVSSNLGLSNLRLIDTLSTTSTFSVEISTAQLKVSTILFDDANTLYNLYSQGGQLYYNNALVGGGGSVSSNLGLSNLDILDTLSTVSTFTSTLVTNLTLTNSLINTPGGLLSYSNSTTTTEGTKVTVDPYTGYFYASGRGNNSMSTILYSSDGSNWSTIQSGGFSSNTYFTGFDYNVYNATAIFGFSTITNEAQSYIFAGGWDTTTTKQVIQTSQKNASIEPVDFISQGSPPNLRTVRCFTQSNTPLSSRVYVGGTPATGGYPLYYSDDMGGSWAPISTTQFSEVYGLVTDMTATPSVTVAVGNSLGGAETTSTIQRTNDGGDTWTPATWGVGTTGFNSIGYDVIVDGTTFYACGDSSTDTNRVLKSTDGLTWSVPGGGVPVDIVNAIATNGSRLVITGTSVYYSYSTIGISEDGGANWYSATTGGFATGGDRGTSIAYANGTWVAVGQSVNNPTSTIIYSTDGGSNWTSANVGQFSGSDYNVGLNVDSGNGTLRSDSIIANDVQLNTLNVRTIDGGESDFSFTWGKSPINSITQGKISTTVLEVSTINGAPYPRMYFSTLQTNIFGEGQWDFPKPFNSANSYSATFTGQVDTMGYPVLVSITERNAAYVQVSSFNAIGNIVPNRYLDGIVLGN